MINITMRSLVKYEIILLVSDAGSAVAAKINSAAMRTTKDKERKTSSSSSQRKK